MIRDLEFDSRLREFLPETLTQLKSANLVIHESVTGITLHGSRGLRGRPRLTSDIDLSLITDTTVMPDRTDSAIFLHEVSEMTRSNWRSHVELDLAIVFDIRNCKLKCFDLNQWDEELCAQGGVDCFGLFKIGKGFKGLVTDAGIRVKLMYPCLKIWSRS
jgi:hypothetical protein